MLSLILFEKLERKLLPQLPKNGFHCVGSEPVISICFDDFPVSAGKKALQILKENGLLASYYLAGSLLGKTENNIPICDNSLVRKVYEEGHEIGCHTFGHLDCQDTCSSQLRTDLKKNADLIHSLTDNAPASFAFPFGKVSFASRKVIGEKFMIARGIRPGINGRNSDLLNLRANSVYNSSFSKDRIKALIDTVKSNKGWLIFYTHDVSPQPSAFGCSVEDFSNLIELIVSSGIRVLPIKHAAGYFAFQN